MGWKFRTHDQDDVETFQTPEPETSPNFCLGILEMDVYTHWQDMGISQGQVIWSDESFSWSCCASCMLSHLLFIKYAKGQTRNTRNGIGRLFSRTPKAIPWPEKVNTQMVIAVDDVMRCWAWCWMPRTEGRRVTAGERVEGTRIHAGSGPGSHSYSFRLCLCEAGCSQAHVGKLRRPSGLCESMLGLLEWNAFTLGWEMSGVDLWKWGNNFKLGWGGTGAGKSDGAWPDGRAVGAFLFLKSSVNYTICVNCMIAWFVLWFWLLWLGVLWLCHLYTNHCDSQGDFKVKKRDRVEKKINAQMETERDVWFALGGVTLGKTLLSRKCFLIPWTYNSRYLLTFSYWGDSWHHHRAVGM